MGSLGEVAVAVARNAEMCIAARALRSVGERGRPHTRERERERVKNVKRGFAKLPFVMPRRPSLVNKIPRRPRVRAFS